MTDPHSLDFTVPDPWGDLPGYALNALTPEERERVDALLERSPEARDELRRYMETVENLAYLTPGTEPSDRVRKLLLAQVDSDIHLMQVAREDAKAAQPAGSGRAAVLTAVLKPARVAYAGTAAALVSVIAIAVVFGMENSQLNSEIGQLRQDIETELVELEDLRMSVEAAQTQFAAQDAEVARLRAVNDGLNEALKNMQWLTSVTQKKEYRVAEYLEGSSAGSEASGTLTVKNFDDPAVLLVSSLPPAPEDYQYVLSLVRDGIAKSVATFQVNEAGMARVEFDLPDNIVQYESVVVTLEALDAGSGSLSGPEVMVASEDR